MNASGARALVFRSRARVPIMIHLNAKPCARYMYSIYDNLESLFRVACTSREISQSILSNETE
jgi:hypothetical protein